MKATAWLLVLMVSGCSFLPSFHAFQHSDSYAAKAQNTSPKRTVASVSNEANKLIEEARSLWPSPWSECTDAQKALAALDKALSMDPLDADALLLRSRALADLGYLEDAFDDATKAIRHMPSAEAYATRGHILQMLNQPQGARRDLAYAEHLDSHEAIIYIYRAAGDFLDNENVKGCSNLKNACDRGACGPLQDAQKDGLCL